MKKILKISLIIISSFFGLILMISIGVAIFSNTPKTKVEKVVIDSTAHTGIDSLANESKLLKLKKYQITKAGKINKKHPAWTEEECTNVAKKCTGLE